MATGLAVVATRSGSIPELITDGGNGRLVAPGSPAELAAAIAGLLASAGERARLGAAAARTVRERFSIEVCEPELARRLRALADRRRTNPGRRGHLRSPVSSSATTAAWRAAVPA